MLPAARTPEAYMNSMAMLRCAADISRVGVELIAAAILGLLFYENKTEIR
jgi:hypothetical protein